jgi:hypothetical protein
MPHIKQNNFLTLNPGRDGGFPVADRVPEPCPIPLRHQPLLALPDRIRIRDLLGSVMRPHGCERTSLGVARIVISCHRMQRIRVLIRALFKRSRDFLHRSSKQPRPHRIQIAYIRRGNRDKAIVPINLLLASLTPKFLLRVNFCKLCLE